MTRPPYGILFFLVACLFNALTVSAAEYTLSLPSYLGNPGDEVEMPLLIDNATGFARVRVQVNYDPQVVTLLAATPGAVGQQFEMIQTDADGQVTLDFLRLEDLNAEAGMLARLKFRLDAGATTDLYTDVAIATFELGDSTGVADLSREHTLKIQNGEIQVSLDPNIDNGLNGLPDWWEEDQNLDPITTEATDDPDGDGLSVIQEFAFGGNANSEDNPGQLLPKVLHDQSQPDSSYLAIEFTRKSGAASFLTYQIMESADLNSWDPVALTGRMIGDPEDMGNGYEKVQIRSRFKMTGDNTDSKGFISLEVIRN